jgi:predicted negative regulator of RcsB-dependent stress response
MATEHLDEHEQSEFVRNWLRNNFGSILLGLAGGIGAIWGVGKYQDWRADALDRAGQQYGLYLAAVEKKDADEIKKLGTALRTEYAQSPYAALSAMSEAEKALAEGGKVDQALASLKWAHDHAEFPELKSLAALRMARALLDAGKFDEAKALVDAIDTKGFIAQAKEVRGDILLAQNQAAEAKIAYEQALTEMDSASPRFRLVEMKRDDLAGLASAAPVAAVEPKAGG